MGTHPILLQDVKRLLAQALRDTEAQPHVRDEDDIVNDLGLDSLQMTRFLLDVEVHFGITLDFEQLDLAQLGSVRHFSGLVGGLLQQQGAG